jgi:hypothetical protein
MRMKQTALCLIAAFFIVSTTLAQTKREILEEDPRLSPNLRFELSPLDFKTGEPYTFGGASLRVSYRANNKFSIAAEVRKEYYDYEDRELKDISNGYTIGNPKPYSGFGYEVTGTYYFITKEKESEQWLPIKSRSVGYRTVEVTIDPVPTSKLNLYGVRGGYGSDKATYAIAADISEVENPSNTQTGQSIYPLETRTFFFGGLSMTRIKNIKVRYPTYGVRRKQVFREIYADVLFGGDPKSGNMVQYDGTGSGSITNYKIDRYSDNGKIGWRVGISATPTGRLINCGYGLELATMPGGTFGLNVKFVLSIMKKVGLKEAE